ncbi:hypothetical protein MTR_2g102390 [Medicago truncatula]|uniref:Uncharacterized protein n=1 Tax=Medicago truncatula TaxID=3880 RepID=G7II62_MEDTR|nr:hypothetical protein MTR_2g102390 [Medicago truncatula]
MASASTSDSASTCFRYLSIQDLGSLYSSENLCFQQQSLTYCWIDMKSLKDESNNFGSY